MSLILITGNATLDIINTVAHYPTEDEKLRVLSQRTAIGGNAANTAIVLAQHHHACEWVGVLADDQDGHRMWRILQDDHKIDLRHAYLAHGHAPVSYITHSEKTGSRTIVNYRDLVELPWDAFRRIPVERYDWLHFEGRNVAVLKQILDYSRENISDQSISLEVEKPYEGIEALFAFADVILFSSQYAKAKGYEQAEPFLTDLQAQFPKHIITCTWGRKGAWITRKGKITHIEPQTLEVVDSVAAGDTFNAGLIHSLATGNDHVEALQYAVRLAERKVTQQGILALMEN